MLTLTGLATGFVHMLHDAEQKLSNPCLPSPDHALALVPLPGLHRHACCPGDVHHGVRRHLLLQAQARRGGYTTALLEDSSLAGATAAAMSGDDEKHTRAMHIVGMRACGGAPA
uniref:Uncharacterized protein n=1 Tax=Aegilops tauschii subsp. strangulata TaxID=200361 RepID=A0A453QTS8_AEGTS